MEMSLCSIMGQRVFSHQHITQQPPQGTHSLNAVSFEFHHKKYFAHDSTLCVVMARADTRCSERKIRRKKLLHSRESESGESMHARQSCEVEREMMRRNVAAEEKNQVKVKLNSNKK